MSEALEPCPFCGGDLLPENKYDTKFIHPEKGCLLDLCEITPITETDKWNTRTELQRTAVDVDTLIRETNKAIGIQTNLEGITTRLVIEHLATQGYLRTGWRKLTDMPEICGVPVGVPLFLYDEEIKQYAAGSFRPEDGDYPVCMWDVQYDGDFHPTHWQPITPPKGSEGNNE